jgi:zinc transport system substrate-binding protein
MKKYITTKQASRLLLPALLIIAALIPGCGANGARKAGRNQARAETISVVAANFPAYDFCRAVAGDLARLVMLLPPGAESHSWEPSPQDIIAIQNADVFIYTGGESDAMLKSIIEKIEADERYAGKRLVAMMDAVEPVTEELLDGMEAEEPDETAGETGEPEYDEHVWTAPRNAARIVGAIAETLCAADPKNAAAYRRNAAAYSEQLDELDAAFRQAVAEGSRRTVIFGDRFPFRYLADAYGLECYAAFPGCSTETEPSAATLAFLIDTAKRERLPVVFHIELSNERMADTIAEAAGAKKLLLHSGHNISKKDFERGVSYLDIMRQNTVNLREALR